MRILTIIDHLGPGGTQRAAQTRSIAYAERGHDVAVLAYAGAGPRLENLIKAGLQVFVGGNETSRAKAIREAADWAPDLAHVHRTGLRHAASADVVRHLRTRLGADLPAMEVNHFGRVDYSPDRSLFSVHLQLSRWCLWKFNQWSRGLKPQPVAIVCPHLMNTEAFYPEPPKVRAQVRERWGVPSDAFVFGRVGQPMDAKWHPMIFQAFTSVAQERPDAWMVLVGAPPDYASRIAALPQGIRERVVQPDFMHGDDALRECYSAMDVFLHAATIGESFGQVFGECQLCEVPVITLSTPLKDNSQLEVVGHMRGGVIINDTESMIEAMKLLHEDAELRRRLARAGAAFVRENFAVRPLADRLLRASSIVLAVRDRGRLERAFREAGFDTDIPTGEVEDLMRNSLGSIAMREQIALRAVHSPMLYKTYLSMRGRTGRIFGH